MCRLCSVDPMSYVITVVCLLCHLPVPIIAMQSTLFNLMPIFTAQSCWINDVAGFTNTIFTETQYISTGTISINFAML